MRMSQIAVESGVLLCDSEVMKRAGNREKEEEFRCREKTVVQGERGEGRCPH